MSDRESHQASIDASEASIPAENGSREVEHAPPPLGSEENYSHRRSRVRLFWRMGKEALGSPLSFLLSFSLFPIFLSGVGVRVSVLGLGFFHLSSFFDNNRNG